VRSGEATAVCRRARQHAERVPGATNSAAALRRAASELHVVMTENKTALTRAAAQAEQLAQHLEVMNRSGALHDFNRM
jgi:hypothetical protein